MVWGDLQLAGSLLAQALELARRAGNREVEVARLYNLGMLSLTRGNRSDSECYILQGQAVAAETGDRQAQARLLTQLGVLAIEQNAPDRAVGLLEEDAGLAREIGDAMGVGFALCQEASLRTQQRNYREALRLSDQARPWSERARTHQDLDELHAHRSWLLGQISVTESRRKDGRRRRHPQK